VLSYPVVYNCILTPNFQKKKKRENIVYALYLEKKPKTLKSKDKKYSENKIRLWLILIILATQVAEIRSKVQGQPRQIV
jgi:hypothetical protein